MENDTTKAIKHTITRLLANREHSKAELQRKLQAKGFDLVQCLEWIERFAEQNIQCDQRFAESYVRRKVDKGLGETRIRAELKQLGVSDKRISRAITSQQPDWFELAKHVFEKKYGTEQTTDAKIRQKQQRFMFYRGFDHEQVMYAMG